MQQPDVIDGASAKRDGDATRHSRYPSPPTFLGIGSMRCGSTWLYQVLKCHPDIRMSDLKEVDYFFMPRMLEHDWRWYEELFRTDNGTKPKRIRGEISPRYARLKAWQVNRIARLLPDLRIILILRHPIERAWSQTLYDFGRLQGRDIRRVSTIEIFRQLERARSKLSSDYLRTVEIWSKAFGREALNIGFFDDLRDHPQLFIADILRHIGANPSWTLPPEFIKKKVWATNSLVEHELPIPEVIEWYIADGLFEPTKRLNEILQGRVSHWIDDLERIRGKRRLSWRILKNLNRRLLSIPETLAAHAYHGFLDGRFWFRWHQIERSYALTGDRPVQSQSGSQSISENKVVSERAR